MCIDIMRCVFNLLAAVSYYRSVPEEFITLLTLERSMSLTDILYFTACLEFILTAFYTLEISVIFFVR